MFSREIADRLKIKFNCKSDRTLAERMQIKYGTFANWMARDSMQFDILIQFLIKENVDLNEIFNTDSNITINTTSKGESEFQQLSDELKQKCEEYRDFGGKKMIESFKADLEEMIKRYDKILTGIQTQIADYLKERNK